MAQLLREAGAKLLSRPPAAMPAPRAAAGPCTSFLLCEAPDAPGGSPGTAAAEAQQRKEGQAAGAVGGAGVEGAPAPAVPPAVAASKWYQRAVEGGVLVVNHRWLLDSISWYTLQPLAKYRM